MANKQYQDWVKKAAKQIMSNKKTEEQICEIIAKLHDDSHDKFLEEIRKRKLKKGA